MKYAIKFYSKDRLVLITEYSYTYHQAELVISQLPKYLKDKSAEIIAENGLPF